MPPDARAGERERRRLRRRRRRRHGRTIDDIVKEALKVQQAKRTRGKHKEALPSLLNSCSSQQQQQKKHLNEERVCVQPT